jgi:hypothetical protein
VLPLAIVLLAAAQEPSAPPVEPPKAADPAAPAEPAEPPSPPALEFKGKPLVVPFACTEETLHAAGLTCPETEPCPVYLELAALEAVGATLFVVGNLHSSANTFSSIALRSDDGGRTWVEMIDRMPQVVLDAIQFADLSTGWISGQILAQLPRDPFFLVTTDGGKTWKRRPLSDESQVAAIDSFFFENRTDGWMILDRSRSGEPNARYQLFETRTGGDTWMLRQSSGSPLALKRSRPPAATGWRLRADGPSKSYRVEKLQGNRWTLVASFLVRLPDCSIGLNELAPPPEPEPAAAAPPPAAAPAKKGSPSLRKKTP